MIINGKTYAMPELDFNAMCMLEEMGLSLTDMDKKVLTTVRGFLALAMGGDYKEAGKELETHMADGGSLDQLLQEINQAVEESGFFRSLAKRKAAENGTGQETPEAQTQPEVRALNPSER